MCRLIQRFVILCQKYLHGGPASVNVGPRCAAQGCAAPVPNRCRVRFCQDHCASPRCSVHAQQTRTQERHCRFRGCEARVPPECSSGFCHGHCTSPRCSVHVPARPRCAFSGCNSPACPGCLVVCCTVHCTHAQCSPQGANRPRRNERVHPECSTNRCTLHCSSPDCPFHSCPNGKGAGTR